MESFLNLDNYTLENLQQLINSEAEEYLKLEFKAAPALSKDDKVKTEISKDVSSFANSDGGIIIYGMLEKKDKPLQLSYIDSGKFSKEWLEQIIDSSIQKQIPGLRIFPIYDSNDKSKVIYVVKIPASSVAPHRAKNGLFYKRHNFTTAVMEEYEIRQLYNRKERTELQICNVLGVNGTLNESPPPISADFRLEIQIQNISNGIEHHYKLEIQFPRLLADFRFENIKSLGLKHRDGGDNGIYTSANSEPIYQNEIVSIGGIGLRVTAANYDHFKNGDLKLKIYYTNGITEKSYKLYELCKCNMLPIDRFQLQPH